MRLSPPISVLAILAVGISMLAITRFDQERNRRFAACGAASTYLRHVLSQKPFRPYFFETSSTYRRNEFTVDQFLRSEDGREFLKPEFALDIELAREKERVGAQTAITKCPEIKDILVKEGVPYGVTDNTRLPTVKADGWYAREFISISMPALNRNKDVAALEYSSVSGPLAGGGTDVRLERQKNGTWAIKEERPTWIS